MKSFAKTRAFTIPEINHNLLNWVMRRNCFPEIMELCKDMDAPAKEITESMVAIRRLMTLRNKVDPEGLFTVTWAHVGDGSRCLTAAMGALLTKDTHISIDPVINMEKVTNWMDKHHIQRFIPYNFFFEDWLLNDPLCLSEVRFVTFVHSHVDTDDVLEKFPNWWAAYTNPCCHKAQQRSRAYNIYEEGEDYRNLSPQREFQVLINRSR